MKGLLAVAALSLGAFACMEVDNQAEDASAGSEPSFAQRAPGSPMTLDRLDTIINAIDPNAQRVDNAFNFTVPTSELGPIGVNVITDPAADRMRIVIGVTEEETLTPDLWRRVMQANFDSALDARYALSQEVLWATYIHPLSPLTDEEFVSGLSQTVTLVLTFGTTFSSGMFIYGGGDSGELLEELQEELDRLVRPQI